MCGSVCVHTILFSFLWYHGWNVTVLCLKVLPGVLQCPRPTATMLIFMQTWEKHEADAIIKNKHTHKKKLQGARINVRTWFLIMFGWLSHYSGCDTPMPRHGLGQRRLLSLLALTHTLHSPRRCPEASLASLALKQPNLALGPRALFWELKSHNCRADSDSVGDTLTWLERMKTSTVRVKPGGIGGGGTGKGI